MAAPRPKLGAGLGTGLVGDADPVPAPAAAPGQTSAPASNPKLPLKAVSDPGPTARADTSKGPDATVRPAPAVLPGPAAIPGPAVRLAPAPPGLAGPSSSDPFSDTSSGPSVDPLLIETQRRLTDYFDYWRAGKYHHYDRERRKPIWEKLQFPRKKPWAGPGDPAPLNLKRYERSDWRAGRNNPEATANQAIAELNRSFHQARCSIVKTLGVGGNGIAALIELTNLGGAVQRYVIKGDVNHGSGATAGEARWYRKVAGAKHILRRVRFRHLPMSRVVQNPDGPPVPQDNSGQALLEMVQLRKALDDNESLLLLEYMERGNLEQWISKMAARPNGRFPNRVLWLIFRCLIKGCLALAYPGLFNVYNANPDQYEIPDETETPAPDPPTNPLVHFDLDPLNVMVSGFDESHMLVPVVKIGDLGSVKDVRRYRFDRYYAWGFRRQGKYRIYPPEAFTPEWDRIVTVPSDYGEKTAGNYGEWTNLYQAALIMASLVTLCKPEYPPQARVYAEQDGQAIWSYGVYLMDPQFNSTSRTLRGLIGLCLNHVPADRPSLAEVYKHIEEILARDWSATESDVDVRAWATDFFASP